MTKQAFIEMIENMPDDAELVVSNYTIGFVATDVEYNELYFFRPNGRPIPGWRQSSQYVYIRFPSGPWR
jgi:hypothetical protein